MIPALMLVVFPLLLVVAAMKDATTMTIPNWIPLTLAASFLVLAPLQIAPMDMGQNFFVALGMLTVGFGMFSLNWLGGGDAKLLAASALWLGWPALPEFAMWTALAGGGLSLALLGARQAFQMLPFSAGSGAIGRLLEPKGDIPYGLAIAAGGLAAFPKSAFFLAAVGGGA